MDQTHRPVQYKDYPVLIVDDDENNLKMFTDEFSHEFTIFKAKSGQEALNFLENYRDIAVVVVDQRMPGMTGVEFLMKVSALYPSITRILITAFLETAVLIDAINKGNIYKYIPKPWNKSDLRDTVASAIEIYASELRRRQLFEYELEIIRKEVENRKISAMNTFVGGLAHEISNPLVAVYTFLDMLPIKLKELRSEHYDESYWDGYYQVVENNVKRIKSIINELFNLARPSSFNFNTTDVVDLLKKDLDVYETLSRNSHISFRFIVESPIPPAVIDGDKIRQLVLNIVANAIQATKKGGKVELKLSGPFCAAPEASFSIEVTDTGSGIEKKDIPKIFDLFYSTKNKKGNSGLGLPISSFIVREHGGTIKLSTVEGKGTRVFITIPFYPVRKAIDTAVEEVVKNFFEDEKD